MDNHIDIQHWLTIYIRVILITLAVDYLWRHADDDRPRGDVPDWYFL